MIVMDSVKHRQWNIADAHKGDIITWNIGDTRVIAIYKGLYKHFMELHESYWYMFRQNNIEQLICGDSIAFDLTKTDVRLADESEQRVIKLALPLEEYKRIFSC